MNLTYPNLGHLLVILLGRVVAKGGQDQLSREYARFIAQIVQDFTSRSIHELVLELWSIPVLYQHIHMHMQVRA